MHIIWNCNYMYTLNIYIYKVFSAKLLQTTFTIKRISMTYTVYKG